MEDVLQYIYTAQKISLETLTDEIIEKLIQEPKIAKSKRKKNTQKMQHDERNYEVISKDGENSYTLIFRQSRLISSHFSCGLILNLKSSQNIILLRYNGGGHSHKNPIEKESFDGKCHIHKATERYIKAGKKAELYAEITDRYTNATEAFQCLIKDCNIDGISEEPDKKQLELI